MMKLGMEKITNKEKVLSPLSLLNFVFGILPFFPTELCIPKEAVGGKILRFCNLSSNSSEISTDCFFK